MSKHLEINVETNEVVERDLTAEELKQQKIDLEKANEYLAEMSKLQQEKSAVLAKLGITAEEAKLLLS